MKKKLLMLTLALMMIFSVMPVANAARIPLTTSGGTTRVIASMSALNPVQLTGSMTAGIYFVTDEALKTVQVSCPSYDNSIGNLTLTLYKWQGSYNTTISSQPIVQKVFKDFTDSSYLTLILPADKVFTGEFLVVVSDPVEIVGVWTEKGENTVTSEIEHKCFLTGQEYNGSFRSRITTAPLPTKGEENPEATIEKKDAYNRIYVDQADELAGPNLGTRVDGDETLPYLNSGVKTGSYAYFGKVDFGDTSPKGFRMRLYNQAAWTNFGETQVVLDDVNGYPIATTSVYLDVPERVWQTATADITEKVTGVHDVYLIFRGREFCPAWFEFTKETPEKTNLGKELEDYKNSPAIDPVERYEDTWVATDMLGRKLPDNSEVGDPREGKQVGLFYHTWTAGLFRTTDKIYDVTKVLNAYEGNPDDIKQDLSYKGWGAPGKNHTWNESVYGYYLGYDEWVMRKQMELFAAADVDALFFDCTNGDYTWAAGYMKMGKIIHELKLQGIDAPQMSFITPFSPNEATVTDIESLYNNMYSLGLYSDAWFYWKGKPLLLSYPDLLNQETGYADVDAQRKEMLDFFTFRSCQPNYWCGPMSPNQWPWLEVAPQHGWVRQANGKYECVPVGTAQNTNDHIGKGTYSASNADGSFGRSYTYLNKFKLLDETSSYYGYNFQEQWENALQMDPEFIFITGWNERIFNRYAEKEGVVGAFIDSYNNENSRDIEPIKSDFKDNYYFQMVKNIRRFKGVQKTPEAGAKVTVDINGSFDQWNNVALTYYDYTGVPDRDQYRTGMDKRYVNTTGRNDFVISKAARDDENLYFYTETAENITPYTDDAWMRLFLNTDRLIGTGWEGYDYAINIEKPTENKAVLSKSTGFWQWENAGEVEYKVEGNKMMVKIPKSMLDLSGTLDIEFKWADNMQTHGNLMEDFYTNGDTAPIARYNYRFVENVQQANKKNIDEFIFPASNPYDMLRHFTVLKIDCPIALTDAEEEPIDSSNSAVTPIIYNDRTMVPIRFVSETLGAQNIEWNEKENSAMIEYYQHRIKIYEGGTTLYADKKQITLDTPAFTYNDRLYIPLRAVAEGLGVKVYWEDPCYIFIGNYQTEKYMNNPDFRRLMNAVFADYQ